MQSIFAFGIAGEVSRALSGPIPVFRRVTINIEEIPGLTAVVAADSLDWLHMLADSTRVRLLRVLEKEELTVSELCRVLLLPQSTVSRHLKLLSNDGWIASRRTGTNRRYRMLKSHWTDARSSLWAWVRSQSESPSVLEDEQRLSMVLSERSRSEAFFSSTAQDWDRLRVELFGATLDANLLAACLPQSAVVAELGCGSAPVSQLVAPFVEKIFAVDNSSAMLAAAQQRLVGLSNVELVESPLEELPGHVSSLDFAWMMLVLPYLADPVSAFKGVSAAFKRSAKLVIVDLLPHDREEYLGQMGHLRLGVSRNLLEEWGREAQLELTCYRELPSEPSTKGPALFSASMVRLDSSV